MLEIDCEANPKVQDRSNAKGDRSHDAKEGLAKREPALLEGPWLKNDSGGEIDINRQDRQHGEAN